MACNLLVSLSMLSFFEFDDARRDVCDVRDMVILLYLNYVHLYIYIYKLFLFSFLLLIIYLFFSFYLLPFFSFLFFYFFIYLSKNSFVGMSVRVFCQGGCYLLFSLLLCLPLGITCILCMYFVAPFSQTFLYVILIYLPKKGGHIFSSKI